MKLPKIELDVFETILARRSVRSYKALAVNDKKIRILLEAAVRAPTSMHAEPWAFVIIQDKQMLSDLSACAKPLFDKRVGQADHALTLFSEPDFNIFYNAGTLIIICARSNGDFVEADCWLAAQNLMLAACAMGLGTCVIGSALLALNVPEIKSQLGIGKEYEAVAPIIVGYPKGQVAISSRNRPQILSRFSIS